MVRKAEKSVKSVSESVSNDRDPLLVQSVEKAFRVLRAFDGSRPTLSLSQIAEETGLDISAAQRFTYTLTKLGYLTKSSETKRFELGVKALDFGYHYSRASVLVERGTPYLLHLSKTTEETVNLTVLDETDIVFVQRFMSRHVLNNDVVTGMRLPAYCTAPGIAILSALSDAEANAVLDRSHLHPYTPHTTWNRDELNAKLKQAAAKGYATAFEEYFHGDLSFASPILDARGHPYGAINIAVSRSRYTPEEAEEKYAPLVTAAARSITLITNARR
ncbi:IclR family transcriptional regulator C-terminal domain-containing protein [Ochrobactrum sp. 3-3]|uniref:IclR family transcriptional regulator n=1 Tax=Ochrobactrum sp. 3-3 TaxID=1830124 RepID=UPI000DEF54B6|nr:IclR family transcriptional regulator C-terminal domain-containing protein [Ochrobactrum sp. 3-3]